MDDIGWLEQHARVLFETEAGRITRLNEPDPETEAPRVFLARGPSSTLILFRADVPDAVASSLAAVAGDLATWNRQPTDDGALDPLRRAVGASLGEAKESNGPAFRFPRVVPLDLGDDVVLIDGTNEHLLDLNFPYTRSVLGWRRPVAAIIRDGVAVSACYSARRRPTAAEAGVDTVERHRGRRLAVATVSAWAVAVQGAGLTPLYSTSWDNSASLRVAAKLGLEAYADTVSFK